MSKDFVGFGALNDALLDLQKGGYRKVFVVVSENGWKRFNAKGIQLFFPDRECVFFHDFSVNPDFSEIRAGCKIFESFQPDLIVAIGGGSPIDVAKCIKALYYTKEPFNEEKPATIKPSGEGPPLVAIATTAGSGSEATQYSVFYRGMDKQTVAGPSVRPDITVVDPELTYDMPAKLTAECGFDALTQAVESYWGTFAVPESRTYARDAIKYILPNIYNAVHDPKPDNRYNMSLGSYLAGKAINFSKTTIPHALGYHLTKKYGLPHGHAVAITVPACILLNTAVDAKVTTPAGKEDHDRAMEDVVAMLGQETPEDAVFFWRNLMKHCGLEPSLKAIGMDTPEKYRVWVQTLDVTRLGNHPVAVDEDLLIKYLNK